MASKWDAKENGDTATIAPKWHSSVIQQDRPVDLVGELSGAYWKGNMTNTGVVRRCSCQICVWFR